MMLRFVLSTVLAVALMGVAGSAEAHLLGETGGLSGGFAHPLSGLDHVLAMLAVGMWAAQLGGRAVWLVPLSFVAMMTAGGAVALAGLPLPLVELGIAGSVVVFGALIAFAARLPVGLGMAVVGAFALFHGHAHGTEIPAAASAVAYAAGFVAATGLLHAAGALTAFAAARRLDARWVRAGGGAVTAAGLLLLAGL
jgi:urease accessory protein